MRLTHPFSKIWLALGATTALFVGSMPTEVDAARVKSINWQWSDGGTKNGRSLSKRQFGSPERLPTINVTIKPRAIPRNASLQYWDPDEGWTEEYRVQSVNGLAVLQISPLCGDGTWCNGTFKFRIVVEPSGDQPTYTPAEFSVKFVNSGSGGSGSGGSSGGGSSGGSSSSGGGISAASFIGWNLERVQDYLGYDPRTMDCSGTGRSVWWSSNWWVINTYGGVLIVSKSRYGCS